MSYFSYFLSSPLLSSWYISLHRHFKKSKVELIIEILANNSITNDLIIKILLKIDSSFQDEYASIYKRAISTRTVTSFTYKKVINWFYLLNNKNSSRKAGKIFMFWLKSLLTDDWIILADIDYVSPADGIEKNSPYVYMRSKY